MELTHNFWGRFTSNRIGSFLVDVHPRHGGSIRSIRRRRSGTVWSLPWHFSLGHVPRRSRDRSWWRTRGTLAWTAGAHTVGGPLRAEQLVELVRVHDGIGMPIWDASSKGWTSRRSSCCACGRLRGLWPSQVGGMAEGPANRFGVWIHYGTLEDLGWSKNRRRQSKITGRLIKMFTKLTKAHYDCKKLKQNKKRGEFFV